MKKITTILILFVLTCTLISGSAFSFRSGKSSFEFLRLPVGASNLALNQTNLGSIDNSLAGIINPARLIDIQGWDLRAGNSDWLMDMSYQYASVGKRVSDEVGVMSLAVRNFSYGEFEYTKPWGYDVDPSEDGETFTGGAIVSTLAWGKKLTSSFAFGVSLNYGIETLEEYSMDNLWANVGFSYENEQFIKGLRLRFVAENFAIGSTTYFENSDATTLPLVMRYGLYWDVYTYKAHHFILEFNASQFKDQDIYFSAGLTYSFNSLIFLYAGYTSNQIYSPFSAGAGLKFQVAKMLWDATVAFNSTEQFDSYITFEIGAMLF